MITPFARGVVDTPRLAHLVDRLTKDGVAGFVVCGSTGEAALLDEPEQTLVLATALEAADGKPVWMGLAGPRPELVAERSRSLARAFPGVAGFLLAPPAYLKPSPAGVSSYLFAVADAAPRPLIAYDVPARTGVRIDIDTRLALAAHGNVIGLKDCSGDRAAAEAVIADGRMALLAGNDDELFDQLARGAAGGITASAHLATASFVALAAAFADRSLDDARFLWRRLAPLTRALFAEPNPSPIKALLAAQGVIENELRAPMMPAAAATVESASRALRAVPQSPSRDGADTKRVK